MIKNRAVLRKFEKKLLQKEKVDFQRNLCIVNALHRLARKMGKFSQSDPLDGLDVDIRIARVINRV